MSFSNTITANASRRIPSLLSASMISFSKLNLRRTPITTRNEGGILRGALLPFDSELSFYRPVGFKLWDQRFFCRNKVFILYGCLLHQQFIFLKLFFICHIFVSVAIFVSSIAKTLISTLPLALLSMHIINRRQIHFYGVIHPDGESLNVEANGKLGGSNHQRHQLCQRRCNELH